MNNYTSDVANAMVARWKQLGEYLLVKYMDGNMKKEKNGHFQDNGYGLSEAPSFPGYSKEYYEAIAKTSGDRLKVVGSDSH